jgi:hypothetical protein
MCWEEVMTESKPVELLRDRRGIYGIGVSDAYDIEALAWACGIDETHNPNPPDLILRPDMLRCAKRSFKQSAVLQKITGGFRHGMFSHSREESLRQVIHHEALLRAGLPWPPPESIEIRSWSRNKKQQDRNRQIYHGLRLGSLHSINKLIGITLQEAADPDAVRVARRFAFHYRECIYRAGAKSRRALQLAEAFPALALAVYCPNTYWYRKTQEAADLVERGARLRDVAALMQIPMALRRVKPGAAHLVVCPEWPLDPRWINPEWIIPYLPDSLPRMRVWLRAIYHAHMRAGSDFAEWTARHASQIPYGSKNELSALLDDAADWVRANHGNDGHQFVVRPFKPTMSLRTVMTLSAEWHETVASNLTGPQHTFPEPWFPAATINGVEIIPIDNSADLYREGVFMHHCIGTYADKVLDGRYCVYSIRRNGERVASAGLVLQGARAELDQLRGPYNARAPKQITATVERWVRTQAPRGTERQ